jgi:hypothetical protein
VNWSLFGKFSASPVCNEVSDENGIIHVVQLGKDRSKDIRRKLGERRSHEVLVRETQIVYAKIK